MASSRNKKDWLVVTNEPQGVLGLFWSLSHFCPRHYIVPPPRYFLLRCPPLSLFPSPTTIIVNIKWLCTIMLCRRVIYLSLSIFARFSSLKSLSMDHHEPAWPLQLPHLYQFNHWDWLIFSANLWVTVVFILICLMGVSSSAIWVICGVELVEPTQGNTQLLPHQGEGPFATSYWRYYVMLSSAGTWTHRPSPSLTGIHWYQ